MEHGQQGLVLEEALPLDCEILSEIRGVENKKKSIGLCKSSSPQVGFVFPRRDIAAGSENVQRG